MKVYIEKHTEQNRWWVCMDAWRVGFGTAAEAEQFVERLTARLDAPHSLDMLAGGSLRSSPGERRSSRFAVAAPADRRCAKEA